MKRRQKDEGGHHHSCVRRSKRLSSAKQKFLNNTNNNDDLEALPELTDDLLELIAKRLNVLSFCAFAAACKRTKKICKRIKEEFLESIAPLVMFASTHDMMKTNYLFDMTNRKSMKLKLNNMDDKVLVGSTEGYIVFEKKRGCVFLVNPLTGHQLSYTITSFIARYTPIHDHIVMATILTSKSRIVLAVSNNIEGCSDYQIFHTGCDGLLMEPLVRPPWLDVVVFKNQFFVVTREAQLGELRLEGLYLKFNWIKVKNTPKVDSQDLKLIVSDNQLFLVDFNPEKYLNIYKIDFDVMEWIKVNALGEQALFLGGKLGSAMRKPGKWGCPSNCVYYLENSPPRCCIYSLEAKVIDNFPIEGDSSTSSELCSLGWYYPDQCMKVNYVTDEEI